MNFQEKEEENIILDEKEKYGKIAPVTYRIKINIQRWDENF